MVHGWAKSIDYKNKSKVNLLSYSIVVRPSYPCCNNHPKIRIPSANHANNRDCRPRQRYKLPTIPTTQAADHADNRYELLTTPIIQTADHANNKYELPTTPKIRTANNAKDTICPPYRRYELPNTPTTRTADHAYDTNCQPRR